MGVSKFNKACGRCIRTSCFKNRTEMRWFNLLNLHPACTKFSYFGRLIGILSMIIILSTLDLYSEHDCFMKSLSLYLRIDRESGHSAAFFVFFLFFYFCSVLEDILSSLSLNLNLDPQLMFYRK
jgi:hypothetical protein